jgi:aminobenzoyl-glutamate utilization protein B
MRQSIILLCSLIVAIASTRPASAQQADFEESIRRRADSSWETALKIWEWAEVGYQEKRSSEALAGTLEAAGFKVERGVCGIPTAFIATVGSGKPVVAILGEFDALPGISQQAVPRREVRPGASAGHAYGHHLFGVASASASVALAEQIQAGRIKGTLRFYACPAEEGGSAKAFLVRGRPTPLAEKDR